MTHRPINVALLGDPAPREFRPIVDVVRSWEPAMETRAAVNTAALRHVIDDAQWFPDLIVVLQSWPDQFSESEVIDLLSLCPLARLVCCFGPWCDSDGRTRSIWPLATRVPTGAATGRLARELVLLENGEAPRRVPLPLTAARAEIFEFDCDRPVVQAEATAAAVVSPDRRWKEMITSVMRAGGLQIHNPQSADRAGVIVFDADPWDPVRDVALRAIRAADRQAQIVAAVGFPRPDLQAALFKSGADRIWFKLAPLHTLFGDSFKIAGTDC